jgi:hypothetical protein
MKKLLALPVVAAILAVTAVTGSHSGVRAQTGAATATPAPTATVPPGPPIQGKTVAVLLYVDTVTGPIGKPAGVCIQTNLFKQGQMVVFRMWGNNVKAGGAALTAKNVTSALIQIPGADPIKLNYTSHSGNGLPRAVSYWEAPWAIPATYPLGVVDFSIVVKTKANKKVHLKSYTGRFSQADLSPSSRLTVSP